jgi:hypothetical protein
MCREETNMGILLAFLAAAAAAFEALRRLLSLNNR